MSYNGWENYETWNVALWIGNDEGLYNMAKHSRHYGYLHFVRSLKELDLQISNKTPDGVNWDDNSLDLTALNNFILEL